MFILIKNVLCFKSYVCSIFMGNYTEEDIGVSQR